MNCKGCRYSAAYHALGRICDYAEREGRCRLPQLTAEDRRDGECPFGPSYRKGSRPAAARPGRRFRLDTAELRRLYDAGMTDAEIGQAMGCSVTTVHAWRAQEKLPSQQRKRLDDLWTQVRALYMRGLKDTEIAQRAAVSKEAVCRWRERNGLPANTKSNRKRKEDIDL